MRLVRVNSVAFAALALAVGLTLFQNCSSPKDFSSTTGTSYQSGNGGSYEGKTYHYAGQCSDGSSESTLTLHSSSSASLTRLNCQPVLPPLALGPSEFNFNPTAPSTVEYSGRTYLIENQVANKAAYVQGVEFNSYTGTLNYSTPPFSNLTRGNLIVCSIIVWKPSNVVQVSDRLGNIYQRVVSNEPPDNFPQVGDKRHEIWYAANIQGGSTQVSVQMDSTLGGGRNVNCSEYSGIATDSPVLTTHTSFGSSSGLAEVGPISVNATNALVYAMIGSGTAIASTGFNVRSTLASDVYFDSFLTAPGTVTATGTVDSGWLGSVVIFRSK